MCNTNGNSLSGNLLINLGSSQFQLAQVILGRDAAAMLVGSSQVFLLTAVLRRYSDS